MTVKAFLAHPRVQLVHRIARRFVASWAVVLAVALVTVFSMDIGPLLRGLAESQGSRLIERPMRIGRLSVRLAQGRFQIEDLVIDGITPQSPAFFVAERITISMRWQPMLTRRVVFDDIEMTDWRMFIEYMPDGRHSFPRFTRGGGGRRTGWTVTTQFIRAHRGEFNYQDYSTPWGIVGRNLDVTVGRGANDYRGRAVFSNGRVVIQSYEPFSAAMASTFSIDGGRILFDRIDLQTDGIRSTLVGDVDAAHWPEQMYRVHSEIALPKMRELFFAKDTFSLSGNGQFDGHFHLFRETLPDGRTRNGRELKGVFTAPEAGVNAFRFGRFRSAVRWTPDRLEVTDAGSDFYGGAMRFEYLMAPLGVATAKPVHRFVAEYDQVDMATVSQFLELKGIRFAGSASGRNRLEWPSGRWADHRGEGSLRITPPEGVEMMTRRMPLERIDEREARGELWGPFSPHTPYEPVPLLAAVDYMFGPEWVDLADGRFVTEDTYVEFGGRTAFGTQSTLPFHVSSQDWQASDREFAGILTAFGAPTSAIPIDGFGTFDGVMLGEFRRPRVEGTFAGERMKAWDVVWGAVDGHAVIENNYIDVTDAVIRSGTAAMRVNGRFSAGFPRRDGGEEMNARILMERWPLTDLRHAFLIDDYDLDGPLSGEFRVYGDYLGPYGFGTMRIENGVAYGQRFQEATSSVRFEGTGARLDNIQMAKGAGRGVGAASITWAGTYAFEFDARGVPVEAVDLTTEGPRPPITGVLDFRAGGSGSFDVPRYDVHVTARDLFAADEGIGQIIGDVVLNGTTLTMTMEAASPRLAVSGSGRIALTERMDADLTFNVANTSLDPYLRLYEPRLSPFTTAVASGTVRVSGALADVNAVAVDATVDRLDISLFDYMIANASPIRLSMAQQAVRVSDMRLVGQDTSLDVSGSADLARQTVDVRIGGDANLGILQGFVPNVRSRGRASLVATVQGAAGNPAMRGTMTIEDGRIRHFGVPHALENVTGVLAFDSRAISLDDLSGRLGGGPVDFSGTIGFDGYRLGRLDVAVTGKDMRLRFPEGMRSLVDANLSLQGVPEAASLTGDVIVRDAVYTEALTATGDLLGTAPAPIPGAGAGAGPAPVTVPLTYDIRLVAPSTLQVVNSTMRLVASADLRLQGTFDRPQVFGGADIERGEVRFEGRRYVVTRGSFDFSNPTRIQPFLDIDAETRVRVPGATYRVSVRVTGVPDNPVLTFASDPPLSDVEVLALLFSDVAPGRDVEFSRYSTDITPQQELVRERLARQLTGTLSSEVGRVVEQAIGVDTFQLTPSLGDPNQQSSRLDPAARLTIGKRLSERAYLTYSRSLSSSQRDQIILLEIDQTDRSSWILSRNEDGTYAVDFQLRRTF